MYTSIFFVTTVSFLKVSCFDTNVTSLTTKPPDSTRHDTNVTSLTTKPPDSTKHEYKISIKTSAEWFSGTAGEIYISIYGSLSSIAEQKVDKPRSNEISTGSTIEFTVTSVPLGYICGVTLRKEGGNDWRPSHITVSTSNFNTVFNFNIWFTGSVSHTRYKKVNGGWTQWSEWSKCKTCGGRRIRTRSCSHPKVACGGEPCVGRLFDSAECLAELCVSRTTWIPFISSTPSTTNSVTPTFPTQPAVNSTSFVPDISSTKPSIPASTKTNDTTMNNAADITLPVAVGVTCGAVVLMILLVITAVVWRRKKQKPKKLENIVSFENNNSSFNAIVFSENDYDTLDVPTKVIYPTSIIPRIEVSDHSETQVNSAVNRLPSELLVSAEYYNEDPSSDSLKGNSYYQNTQEVRETPFDTLETSHSRVERDTESQYLAINDDSSPIDISPFDIYMNPDSPDNILFVNQNKSSGNSGDYTHYASLENQVNCVVDGTTDDERVYESPSNYAWIPENNIPPTVKDTISTDYASPIESLGVSEEKIYKPSPYMDMRGSCKSQSTLEMKSEPSDATEYWLINEQYLSKNSAQNNENNDESTI